VAEIKQEIVGVTQYFCVRMCIDECVVGRCSGEYAVDVLLFDLRMSANWASLLRRLSHLLSYCTLSKVSTGIGDCLCVCSHASLVNSALNPSRVGKSIISALIGGNVTSAGWQVPVSDVIWPVSCHNDEACCKLLHTVTFTFIMRL